MVAVGRLLGRSDTAAVGLRSLTVYSSGFLIDVAMRVSLTAPMLDRDFFTHPGSIRDTFHIGIELADGRTFSTSDLFFKPDVDSPEAGISLQRGSGNSHGRDVGWWVWPLPVGDEVMLVTEWPAHGISPTRTALDAREIRDAARRSSRLFG